MLPSLKVHGEWAGGTSSPCLGWGEGWLLTCWTLWQGARLLWQDSWLRPQCPFACELGAHPHLPLLPSCTEEFPSLAGLRVQLSSLPPFFPPPPAEPRALPCSCPAFCPSSPLRPGLSSECGIWSGISQWREVLAFGAKPGTAGVDGVVSRVQERNVQGEKGGGDRGP